MESQSIAGEAGGEAVDRRMAALVGDPGFHVDPYPAYREFLRAPGWRTPSGYRVFSRYKDVQDILRDPTAFGQEGIPYPNFHVLNPPEHTRLRKLVAKAFTQRAVNDRIGQITAFVDELIDDVVADGSMDFMGRFALELPGRVGASLLDVPYEDIHLWNHWLWAIGQFRGKTHYLGEGSDADKKIAKDAAAAAADYFRNLVADRHSVRGTDIVSSLFSAREGEDRLSDEEIMYSLVLILGGSLHTTASQLGNIFRALFEHPDQLALLEADPSLVNGVVEEGLRYDGSLQAEYRVCRVDTEVNGVAVEAGTPIIVAVGAANRDPEQFPDPDRFDIRRENAAQHLTFGMGIHRCLGAQLAQAEMRIAVEALIRRLPSLRQAGALEQHEYDRWRGLRSLPVAWEVA
ncbi:cytochrome P450 [Rhizorhabdus dicambivorans]|uniref:Cytochrome P450 n=1 Tax=Rhizorhabdus dicambivorans TaxID=1850238 RepID=A0A2A4FTF5_9SPHN|nr:cytochrome P450 [Rhizorhabdus dicambivorans]ATE64586.1 cytochrome P450 [Rhizorhabdus dicambivorans]PCE41683.1 cytochrome P450 [Rhizorhabdus dicambivorans]